MLESRRVYYRSSLTINGNCQRSTFSLLQRRFLMEIEMRITIEHELKLAGIPFDDAFIDNIIRMRASGASVTIEAIRGMIIGLQIQNLKLIDKK